MKIDYKDYYYVGIQFLLFLLFLLPVFPQKIGLPKIIGWIGLLSTASGFIILFIAFFKLGKALSPFPTPKPNISLRSSGIYGYIRHPIYSGLILAFFGWGLFQDSPYQLGIALLLSALFYFKSVYEEQKLIRQFGSNYLTYKQKTGRFFPRFLS